MGTRNGRELDLFRTEFYGCFFQKLLMHTFERKKYGWNSYLPFLERLGQSDYRNLLNQSVVGAGLNPDSQRIDVINISFNTLPAEWSDTFAVVYSNSFDQSYDPYKSANEWLRVIKNGGLLILGYSVTQPTKTDPIGNLGLDDILQLFPGELLLYDRDQFNYRYALIEIKK